MLFERAQYYEIFCNSSRFSCLKGPAVPREEDDKTPTLWPSKPTSTEGRVFRSRSNSIKVIAKRAGRISSVLRRRHTAAKQTRQAALRNNWEFVHRIASAAMIVNTLKKSATQSEKMCTLQGFLITTIFFRLLIYQRRNGQKVTFKNLPG